MKKPIDVTDDLLSRAGEDSSFRACLVAKPRETIEKEFGVTLSEDHEIHVHEDTYATTHVVLPPRSKLSKAERESARTGATSLEFLRKTLHDPAPPLRPPGQAGNRRNITTSRTLLRACRESIRRGLAFLESTIDENGAWHCIRYNLADPNIPRHFERPPFVSALCVLALESCSEARAKAICKATRSYLANTIEHPGLWRYYSHLPQDLDSTAICSLAIGTHPWILLGRNIPIILRNRDEEGRFMTWILTEDEPGVVSSFRIEADPVVNANVIAHLGDRPETRDAQRWLESLIVEGTLEGSSKWYPDPATIYYATARAMIHAQPALDQLRPILSDHLLGLCSEKGKFRNILQAAQAMSALYNAGSLESIDVKFQVDSFISSQHEDGSWPELLAFGDQSLRWGAIGQIGHGSEAITSAFCIEALERLTEILEN